MRAKTRNLVRVATLVMMLTVAAPVARLLAECAETATSSSGMLDGELISGYCVTLSVKIVGCTFCECHYMGEHKETGMRMSFVTGGVDDGCFLDLPIEITVH